MIRVFVLPRLIGILVGFGVGMIIGYYLSLIDVHQQQVTVSNPLDNVGINTILRRKTFISEEAKIDAIQQMPFKRNSEPNPAFTVDQPKIKRSDFHQRERFGIVSYIPNSINHAIQFLLFLQGSWRYIVEHETEIFGTNQKIMESNNAVDLLSFCHPEICPELKYVCVLVKQLKEIPVSPTKQNCYAIEHPFETDIPYKSLNSYIMFNRTDITALSLRYKYLLRTDNDVFLTPTLFKLKPSKLLFGTGGYSHTFNKKRLLEIAKRLGMEHQGVHSIGSTWCGGTDLVIKAGQKTFEVTRHIWLNEFDASLPELAPFFKNNVRGEWAAWWRPVSSMYGGEIAINHCVQDLSNRNRFNLDASSCEKTSIWQAPHIHCWHDNCKFSKFDFEIHLANILSGTGNLSGEIVHEYVRNTYPRDVRDMNLQDYATFIAWNSIPKYLKKWFS